MENQSRGKERTTIRLKGNEVVKTYEDLSKNAKKQHVTDAIGEMIVNGTFDDKTKIQEEELLIYGNQDLFVEAKKKAKELGYTNATELFNRILIENKDDIKKYIEDKR